jgi:hypothetical protein
MPPTALPVQPGGQGRDWFGYCVGECCVFVVRGDVKWISFVVTVIERSRFKICDKGKLWFNMKKNNSSASNRKISCV